MYYWLDNPDAWLVSNVEINGRSYTQAEAFSVLGSASNDTRTRVLQQFFAAFLNTLKGANAGAIRSTINDASAWISAHPPSQTLNDTDRLDGETLAAELDAYNNGVIGPGHCGERTRTACTDTHEHTDNHSNQHSNRQSTCFHSEPDPNED